MLHKTLCKSKGALDQSQRVDVLCLSAPHGVRGNTRSRNIPPGTKPEAEPRSFRDYNASQLAHRRSRQGGRVACSLDLLPRWPSQKEEGTEWLAGQMLPALLAEEKQETVPTVVPGKGNARSLAECKYTTFRSSGPRSKMLFYVQPLHLVASTLLSLICKVWNRKSSCRNHTICFYSATVILRLKIRRGIQYSQAINDEKLLSCLSIHPQVLFGWLVQHIVYTYIPFIYNGKQWEEARVRLKMSFHLRSRILGSDICHYFQENLSHVFKQCVTY